jgi:acyl carrier protein
MDVHDTLTRFLSTEAGKQLGPDDDYFALGLVNSLFALELVNFVERQFGLVVEVEDLELDHFRTIDRLAGFVLARTAA